MLHVWHNIFSNYSSYCWQSFSFIQHPQRVTTSAHICRHNRMVRVEVIEIYLPCLFQSHFYKTQAIQLLHQIVITWPMWPHPFTVHSGWNWFRKSIMATSFFMYTMVGHLNFHFVTSKNGSLSVEFHATVKLGYNKQLGTGQICSL